MIMSEFFLDIIVDIAEFIIDLAFDLLPNLNFFQKKTNIKKR